jgi:hypothetical protein
VKSTRARWVTAFLIGIATVTAAAFSWRAAQIGSTAAFDDRQAISETVKVEEQQTDLALAVAADAREYARYREDYSVAEALDREADRLAAAGQAKLASVSRDEATALRRGATRRAADAGVFGAFTIANDLRDPGRKPRPFDFEAHRRALAVAQSTSLDSPGKLDPDEWAREANQIRLRVKHLIRWAFLALGAVFFYTVAEVSTRRWQLFAFAGAGLLVYLAALTGALVTAFF